ncbi:MAG: class II aldolase/adducin family protein [Phycisphaeraceae bacterium]
MSAFSGMNHQNLRPLKEQMCEVGRRIWQKGFCAGNEGNHSLRLPSQNGEERYLCTPTGISKGFLEPNDICVIDGSANLIERNVNGRKPSSEMKLHLAIYHHRPDVQAVIHSHPPHATAFAVAGIPLPEAIHPEAEVFLGRIKYAPYALPSTDALPASVTPLIESDTTTVLMGNHGTVNFSSKDLIDAYYKLEIIDAYSRILLLSRQLGRVNVLNTQEMVDLLRVKQKFGLEDSRLACAEEGCIGQENQPFLASFDVRPAGATCSCDGGAVQQRHGQSPQATEQSSTDSVFEQMVQTITDQILAARK